MTTHRFVVDSVSRWLLLTLIGVACLIWLANTIELAGRAESGAFGAGLLQTPGLLIRVLPLCVLGGVSLGVSRMELRGERRALWFLGHDAVRTGWVVGVLGWVVGLVGFGLQTGPVSEMERRALGVSTAIEEGWVWMDDRLIRSQDGVSIESPLTEPRIEILRAEDAGIPDAWIALRPELESNRVLLESHRRQDQLELQGRMGRVVACGLLAFWAWLPVRPGRKNGLLTVVGFGLGWSLLEVVAHGLARSGLIPVALGVWIPILCLVGCCAGRHWVGQRVP